MDSVESYYLILWNDGTVSIHTDKEIKEPSSDERTIGNCCTVKFKHRCYEGKIACTGKQGHSYVLAHNSSSGILV